MPVVIRELVIRGIVGGPAASNEKNTPKQNKVRSNRAQMTVNMVEEIIKSKKEKPRVLFKIQILLL